MTTGHPSPFSFQICQHLNQLFSQRESHQHGRHARRVVVRAGMERVGSLPSPSPKNVVVSRDSNSDGPRRVCPPLNPLTHTLHLTPTQPVQSRRHGGVPHTPSLHPARFRFLDGRICSPAPSYLVLLIWTGRCPPASLAPGRHSGPDWNMLHDGCLSIQFCRNVPDGRFAGRWRRCFV